MEAENFGVFHRDARAVTGAVVVCQRIQPVPLNDRKMRCFPGLIAQVSQHAAGHFQKRNGRFTECGEAQNFGAQAIRFPGLGLFNDSLIREFRHVTVDRCLVHSRQPCKVAQPDFRPLTVEIVEQRQCFRDCSHWSILDYFSGVRTE